jgi:hypothetical protein
MLTGGWPPRLLVRCTQLSRLKPGNLHLDVSRTRRQGYFGSEARRSDEACDGESAEGCFSGSELTLELLRLQAMYANYDLERYVLRKDKGETGVTVEQWLGGEVAFAESD